MHLRLLLLALAILGATCALVVDHARILGEAMQNPELVRFMRRHGRRGALAERLPDHGRTVDRYGAPLELAMSGSAMQRVVDDLALAFGGADVTLSIDGDLQSAAEAAISGRSGAVVAIEPASGRIRVLVSSPRSAALDRALCGLYPPGSTFKVFVAAAALSAGVDPVFDCPASGYRTSPGAKPIRDSEAYAAERSGRKWKGFGRIGMGEALIHSSNVYFARLGVELGLERYGEFADSSRLRERPVVLSAGGQSLSAAGCLLPDALRSSSELAPVAIGQGRLQLTPLAVAMLASAIANDGVMLRPTLSETARPELWARPFSFDAAARVRKMMRQVVRTGTGRACDVRGLDVCGKTGTAQTGGAEDHAWFMCFAPEKSPRLAVAVVVEHGGFGADAALPVAKAVLLAARDRGDFR